MKDKTTHTTETPMADDRVLTAGNFKPILFSTPMVQAILRGEKTQTRRLCKFGKAYDIFHDGKHEVEAEKTFENILPCKYKIGDILWVRETWHPKRHSFPIGLPFEYKATAKEDGNPTDEPWKPSIFMPKEACRIFLKLKSIRIEKLNDISESDAICEGIEQKDGHYLDYISGNYCRKPKQSYQMLWAKINGKESWVKNPFVWVYEFERTDAYFACS